MVASAEQREIRHGGHAAVRPVRDVVRVAPGRRTIAPGEATVPVAHDHGSTHRAGDDGGSATHVEWFGFAPGDDPADRGVARQAPDDLGMDRPHRVKLAAMPCTTLERSDVDDHGDVRALTAAGRPT